MRWKEPKLAALLRVRSLITMELKSTGNRNYLNNLKDLKPQWFIIKVQHFICHPTCKRTTWAEKALQLLGRQGCVDRASGPERPRRPATQPTAPESSAAGGSVWNPALASGQRGLHTDTPTRPVPVGGMHEGNRSINDSNNHWWSSLRKRWLAVHNLNRKLEKWLIKGRLHQNLQKKAVIE